MNYDELAIQTKALLHAIPGELANLERRTVGISSLNQSTEIVELAKAIEANISQISSNCDRLNNLLSSLEPISRRSQMRLSLDQMRHECKHYQSSLGVAQRRHAEKERELKEREDLLACDFTTNAALRNKANPGSSTVIKLDSELEHHSRLSTVGRRIDEMLASGSASLTALRDQGMTMKTAHRRVMDLMNTLGLSNTVMRLIERRTHQDKVIFWLLVIVSIILMWSVWRYFH